MTCENHIYKTQEEYRLKTVVTYKTFSGFTKKYAEWIAEELSCDIYESDNINIDMLSEYDLIIHGGSLHAVGISGVSIIKKNLEILKDKKLIIFTVGASPNKPGILEEIKENNFSKEEQKNIKFFYFRGGFNYSKLGLWNKFLMSLMKWKIKLTPKNKRTSDERGMLAGFEKPVDFTNKKYLIDLFEYINSII